MSKEFKVSLTKGEIDCLLEAIELVEEMAYDSHDEPDLVSASNKLFKLIKKG